MTIAAILKHKGNTVVHTAPTEQVAGVVQQLAGKRIGAVLVSDNAGQVLGILSERDVVRALAEHGAAVLQMTAAQLMTSEVRTAVPRTTYAEAMEMMTEGRFRHLPVIEDGRLLGIVSIGDIVKARLGEQAQEVDSLKAYVVGAA